MTSTRSKSAGQGRTATPELRFPEFRHAPGWDGKQLSSIADPISERADNQEQHNILTLSGEHGLVLQSEYFGKQIAGTSSERYLKIQRDDFVYNDRTTKASAYGTIKRLKHHPHGIVSPIYKCFRFKGGELPSFWEWYFESGAHEAELRSLANEGARAGRFNVSIDRFLSTIAFSPDPRSSEQAKIAECLSTLDELIGAESQKLDALKIHKQGLMQQLFPREGETIPRLRFPEFREAPEWEQKMLGGLSTIVRGGSPRPIDGYLTKLPDGLNWLKIGDVDKESKFVTKTEDRVRPEALSKTREVFPGDLILSNSMSFGRPYILKIRTCIHDGWIAVTSLSKLIDRDFLYYAISAPSSQIFFDDQAAGSGVKNLNADIIKSLAIAHPLVAEQQRIASCLSSIDGMITAQNGQIEALKTHRKGLMQQLFPSASEVEG